MCHQMEKLWDDSEQSLHYATPDFLWSLVASANFMRLSLLKGAHAASSSAAWQEIRVRGWTPAAGRCSVNVEGEFEMDDAQRRLILSLSNGESKAHDGCMTFMPWIMLAAARHPRPTLTRSCSLWTTGCSSAPVNVALLGSVIGDRTRTLRLERAAC